MPSYARIHVDKQRSRSFRPARIGNLHSRRASISPTRRDARGRRRHHLGAEVRAAKQARDAVCTLATQIEAGTGTLRTTLPRWAADDSTVDERPAAFSDDGSDLCSRG